jgi:hypothetical protein
VNAKAFKVFLLVCLLEGVVATAFYFQYPSEGGNAFFLGYSLPRLLVGCVYLSLLLPLGILSVILFVKRDWQNAVIGWLRHKLSNKNCLLTMTMVLSFAAILTAWLASTPEIFGMVDVLRIAFERLQAGFLWVWLMCVQSLALLILSYTSVYRTTTFWQGQHIWKLTVIFLATGLSLLQWVILLFQIPVFTRLYRWFWYFHEKNIQWGAAVILTGLLAAGVYIILHDPGKIRRNLFLIVVMGYAMQVGFGFIDGGGWDALRQKALQSGHMVYLKAAARQPSVSEIFHHYEDVAGGDAYLQTKPPGLILFYRATQAVIELVHPAISADDRLENLSWAAAYLFPLIASVGVLLLFCFARFFFDSREAIIACLFFVFLPNFVLMPLELDQFLLPILFLIPLVFLGTAFKATRPFLPAVATGTAIYLALFVSFSLLAIIPLSLAWIGLSFWSQRQTKTAFKSHTSILAGVIVGLVLSALILWLAAGYDPLQRYAGAMELHRSFKNFKEGWDQMRAAIILNNSEYASWISFAVAILCVSSLLRSAIYFLKRKGQPFDLFTLALGATYLALNLLGQTRGEVGRLWLFLAPLAALLAAREIGIMFKDRKAGLYYVYCLPFITTLLIYRFQDYW